MKASLFKRVRWIPAIAAAAALSLVGISAPAQAQGAGNINPNTPSSLTIHKYDGDQGPRGDGTELGDTSNLGNPLSGVEFTITPITERNGQPIDLDTDAGWNLIDGATVDQVNGGNGYVKGTPQQVVTGADGTVTTGLPHGLYLVEETDPGDNNIVSPAQPFLVTLPLPPDWRQVALRRSRLPEEQDQRDDSDQGSRAPERSCDRQPGDVDDHGPRSAEGR